MTKNEIMVQIQEIFCDVLDNEDIVSVSYTHLTLPTKA